MKRIVSIQASKSPSIWVLFWIKCHADRFYANRFWIHLHIRKIKSSPNSLNIQCFRFISDKSCELIPVMKFSTSYLITTFVHKRMILKLDWLLWHSSKTETGKILKHERLLLPIGMHSTVLNLVVMYFYLSHMIFLPLIYGVMYKNTM